jgi:hypothetical protein
MATVAAIPFLGDIDEYLIGGDMDSIQGIPSTAASISDATNTAITDAGAVTSALDPSTWFSGIADWLSNLSSSPLLWAFIILAGLLLVLLLTKSVEDVI